MSKQLIIIDTELSADGFKSVCNLAPGQMEALVQLENYFGALSGGNQSAEVKVKVGAVQASCAITFSGNPTAAQACYIGNATITAKASGAVPTNGEFNIGVNATATAANLAATINIYWADVIEASANLGVVSLKAAMPGKSGNGLGVSAGNLSNATLDHSFTGGSDGTTYVIND